MLPRGEVGLIFATIGLTAGVLDDDLYAALLLVVLATTLATPMLLRARYQKLAERAAGREEDLGASEPPGGWFGVRDARLTFAAVPGSHRALELAFAASRRVAAVDPSAELLDWFGSHRDAPMVWSTDAADAFLTLLRDGNARSWRFLDALGVLPRAFSELEPALRDRRDDPFLLDPTGLHRWDTLERLQELVAAPAGADEWERVQNRDAVRLAAFLIDVLGDRDERIACSRRVVQRLDLGARVEARVAVLVGDPTLLLDASRRRDAFDEQSVVRLAAHYGDLETTRAAYLLALAFVDDALDEQAVRELYGLVVAVLQASSWDRDTVNLVQRRRREAELASDGSDPVVQRIASAPHAYLLAERPRRVARHAALVAGWKKRGRDRYLVNVEPPTRHDARVALEVVAPDSPGLLARVAHVLGAAGLDVEHAIVVTWPDGCALESFLLRTTEVPDEDFLREAVKAADAAPITTAPLPDARLEFDDAASPWSTVLRVLTGDAPGALAAIAGAIAGAGVDVHSAEIGHEGGVAIDVFELTGAKGRLLADEREAVLHNVTHGVALAGRRRSLGRAWDLVRASWSSGSDQMADIHT